MFTIRRSPWGAVMFAAIVLFPSSSALRAQASGQTQKPAPAAKDTKDAKDGKEEWLTDAEGRQYKLEPVPKAQAVKMSETQVRNLFGITMDLVREDEKFYYIKLYKTTPAPITKTPPPSSSPARGAKPSSAKPSPGKPSSAEPAPATPPSGKPGGPGKPGASDAAESLPSTSARLRWTAAGTGLPAKGQWREGLVLADVTGDGRLDIAASGARKSLRPPAIFTSDAGVTAWTSAGVKFVAQRPFDYGDIAVADIDGDGSLDAALGIHLRGLMVFRRNADGAFADASTGLPFAANSREQAFSSRAVALTDCNGDGRLDLIALGEGPRVPAPGLDPKIALGLASFIQQADGSWRRAPAGDADGLFGNTLDIADVDGDKKPDAIISTSTLGDARLVLYGDGACGWRAEAIDAVRPRSYVTAVAAGDLNGDGNADVAVGYVEFSTETPSFGVDVLTRGAGPDGRWTRRTLSRAEGRVRVEAIAIGDLDGDTRADVVTVGDAGTATIFLGDGRGGFTREKQTLPSAGKCQGASAVIGDLDGDGLGDIVLSYAQESSSTTPDICTNEGGIAVWKTQKAAGGRVSR